MKITIGKKLGFLIAGILVIALVLGVTSYVSMQNVSENLKKITESAEPMSRAAFEMETTVLATGFGLFGYLHDHDPVHLERIKKANEDFRAFYGDYKKLAHAEKAKEFGKHISEKYYAFVKLANALIEDEDKQHKHMAELLTEFNAIDDLLDKKIKASIKTSGPKAQAKMQATLELDILIKSIARGVGYYLKTHQKQYAQQVVKDSEYVTNALKEYRKFNLTADSKKLEKELNSLLGNASQIAKQIVETHEKANTDLKLFIEGRKELGTLLKEKIQVFTNLNLENADNEGHRVIAYSTLLLAVLTVVSVLVVAIFGLFMIRSITNPIRQLTDAANNISKGNLDAQINIYSDDEIGELANAFKRMKASLKIMMYKPPGK